MKYIDICVIKEAYSDKILELKQRIVMLFQTIWLSYNWQDGWWCQLELE